MKRFYCVVCKRIKRVRKLPILIERADSIDPALRVGECNHHREPRIAKQRPVTQLITRTQAVPQAPVKVQRKQARNAR